MKSIKQTYLYSQVLKEFNYPFGDVFIFNNIVVSEIYPGIIFSWDHHAKVITEDVICYLGTNGSSPIYVSNRIYPYSVIATDWLKFFKNNYTLKGYYVVGYQKQSVINTIFENLFFNSKIKEFSSIEVAIETARAAIIEPQYVLINY